MSEFYSGLQYIATGAEISKHFSDLSFKSIDSILSTENIQATQIIELSNWGRSLYTGYKKVNTGMSLSFDLVPEPDVSENLKENREEFKQKVSLAEDYKKESFMLSVSHDTYDFTTQVNETTEQVKNTSFSLLAGQNFHSDVSTGVNEFKNIVENWYNTIVTSVFPYISMYGACFESISDVNCKFEWENDLGFLIPRV